MARSRKVHSGKCKTACQRLGRAAKACKGKKGFRACVKKWFRNH